LAGIDITTLTEDQYSYHHAKLFGIHNHLYMDPWNTDSIFFIDKSWGIRQARSTVSKLSAAAYKDKKANSNLKLKILCAVF
jgi:hypothetical protein